MTFFKKDMQSDYWKSMIYHFLWKKINAKSFFIKNTRCTFAFAFEKPFPIMAIQKCYTLLISKNFKQKNCGYTELQNAVRK